MDALLLACLLIAVAIGGWLAHDAWNEWREERKPRGVCRRCGKSRPLTPIGTMPPHSFTWRRCLGSDEDPDPFSPTH